MTPEAFCYWLRGFFEMTDAKELTPEQVRMVHQHLSLVFEEKAKDIKVSWDGVNTWGGIRPLDTGKTYCCTAMGGKGNPLSSLEDLIEHTYQHVNGTLPTTVSCYEAK